jgi:hypothetical protein
MEELSKTPFLGMVLPSLPTSLADYVTVLGNKIDHPEAISEEQLRSVLGLYQVRSNG